MGRGFGSSMIAFNFAGTNIDSKNIKLILHLKFNLMLIGCGNIEVNNSMLGRRARCV